VIRESYFEPHRKDEQIERAGLTMTFVDLHRPLQDYADALEHAGFVIERIREIGDDQEPPQRESQLRWRRLPLFLHFRAVRS
jgi:hypothetical protein